MSTAATFHLDVVSPEGRLFGDAVLALHLRGGGGDLGIFPGHLQLLTDLPPGLLRIVLPHDERVLYVSGGILEVQPTQVTILADTVERPEDVNESAAEHARQEAEQSLKHHPAGTVDYQEAQQNLAEAMAKLQVIEWMRLRKKH